MIFLFLYLILIGFLLYVCNLLLKEIYGILLVFGIQISGYLLQQEGLTHLSLMAKSIPGYAIDGNGGQWKNETGTFPLVPLGCWLFPIGIYLLIISFRFCMDKQNRRFVIVRYGCIQKWWKHYFLRNL